MLLRICLIACTSASALTPSPRTPVIRMAAARATAPVFDGKPYSAEVLPATVGRSSAVRAGSTALFAACVPGLPDWWSTASLDPGACSVPLLTMAASSALVAAGWSACGTDLHPITAKARGMTPPKSYTFQLLGLSAPLLASAAVALGWQPLPVTYQPQRHLRDTSATAGHLSATAGHLSAAAGLPLSCRWSTSRAVPRQVAGSGVELAHAVLPFALWSIDVRLGELERERGGEGEGGGGGGGVEHRCASWPSWPALSLAPFPGTFSEPSRNLPARCGCCAG